MKQRVITSAVIAIFLLAVGWSAFAECRIVHILNHHFVDLDSFTAEARHTTPELTEREIDLEYIDFIDGLIAYQVQQKELLERMIAEEGMTAVYVEGWTDEDIEAFKLITQAAWRVPYDSAADPWDDPWFFRKLELGPAAQLFADGKLDILPAETTAVIEAANPIIDGEFQGIDDEATEAREDFIVQRLLEQQGTVYLILGQAHDLSDNIELLAGGDCEYVRTEVAESDAPE